MTPLQLFLVSVILYSFIYLISNNFKNKLYIDAIKGFLSLITLGSIIWGIFYYVKL